MGYISHVDGVITFDPPATATEIRAITQALKNHHGSLTLDVIKERVEVDEGTLIRLTADSIVPSTEEGHKAYTLMTELEDIVSLLPGRRFCGHIQREGEDSGDIERLVIRDGKVKSQYARFVFEDND